MPQYVGGGITASFYPPTPSPADSGVMSPLTPGSASGVAAALPPPLPALLPSTTASPEQLSSSSSPYFSHPSPADSGFTCSNPSPYPLTSPPSASSCGQQYDNLGNNNCGSCGATVQPQCSGHAGVAKSATPMRHHWPPQHMQKQQHHQEIPVNVSRFNMGTKVLFQTQSHTTGFDLRDCRLLGALKHINLSSVGRIRPSTRFMYRAWNVSAESNSFCDFLSAAFSPLQTGSAFHVKHCYLWQPLGNAADTGGQLLWRLLANSAEILVGERARAIS